MTAPVDGVLVVDKPRGPTSHDVVSVARLALGTSKVGHTGTLDPMATGVLALVVGRATRLARYMAGDVKTYEAEVTFGSATDTYDAQGTVTLTTGRHPGREALVMALEGFSGSMQQTPPAYSAKKINGEAAYRLARRETPVLPAPVHVVIHALTLDGYQHGMATLVMRVSAGFYVRSLAHDLGTQLGTGAHLSALRRIQAGAFGLNGATAWDTLKRGGDGAREGLLGIDQLLPDLPAVVLSSEDAVRVRHGQTVQVVLPPGGATVPLRLFDQDARLIGIAEAMAPAGAGATVVRPVVILG